MVVFPAASYEISAKNAYDILTNPTIRIRISFLPNNPDRSFEMDRPIVVCLRMEVRGARE